MVGGKNGWKVVWSNPESTLSQSLLCLWLIKSRSYTCKARSDMELFLLLACSRIAKRW